MEQSISNDSRDFITSLARGLSVIETFDAENTIMTLSDVARPACDRRSQWHRTACPLPSCDRRLLC